MKRYLLLAAASGAALPQLLQGQQALPEIQVTATRAPVAVDEVPAAVTIITGESLRQRGIVSLIDALREVPGAALVQTGSYGAVTSIFLRGGESDYTKLLIDGVPVNAPGGSLNLAHLTTDEIERIEVVRGPAGVLYGADAMSGVIQVITREGSRRTAGEVSARGGSFGAMEFAGRAAGGTGGWNYSAGASRLSSDGIYDFNSGYRNATGNASLGWSGNGGSIRLTGRYGDALARFPTDGNGNVVDRNQSTRDRALTLGMTAERRLGSRVKAAVLATMHRLSTLAEDPQDGPDDVSGYGFASERDATQTRAGIEGRMEWAAGDGASVALSGGVERESEKQDSWAMSDYGEGPFREDGHFEADRSTRFAAAQLRASPFASVLLQAGVRHDDNSAFGGFTTARIGAQWHPAGPARIWAAAGSSFKAPTFSEVFAEGPWEIGNPDLEPEKGRSLEGGVEYTAGRIRMSVSAYHQEFENFIQYLYAAPDQPTYLNLGAAETRGVEVALSARLDGRTSLSGQVSLMRSEVTDTGAVSSPVFALGRSLQRRPSATAALTLARSVGPGSVSVTGNWVGERDDADYRSFPAERITLPSYLTVDAAVAMPLAGAGAARRAELLLRGENLLDSDYLQAVGFPGRGRTLLAGGRLIF